MTIPGFQTLMLPLLKSISDGQEHKTRDIFNSLSNEFGLNEEEIRELLPSGQQPIINNRVGWARTYMLKAGLLSAPKRGYIKITEKGLEVLEQNPDRIDVKFLEQFPEFIEFRTIKKIYKIKKMDTDFFLEE